VKQNGTLLASDQQCWCLHSPHLVSIQRHKTRSKQLRLYVCEVVLDFRFSRIGQAVIPSRTDNGITEYSDTYFHITTLESLTRGSYSFRSKPDERGGCARPGCQEL